MVAGQMKHALVVIPTYNERETIAKTIELVLAQNASPELQALDVGLEVLVVDDGSPDGTADLVRQMMTRIPGAVHLIVRQIRGRGSARIAAFTWAFTRPYDYLVEMDADLSHDPRYLPELIRAADRWGVAVGSRYVRGARQERDPVRKALSVAGSLYLRFMLGNQVRDWQGGFRCYRRDILKALPIDRFVTARYMPNSYAFGVEILYRIVSAQILPKEIPIVFRDRKHGAAKSSKRDIFEMLLCPLLLRAVRVPPVELPPLKSVH